MADTSVVLCDVLCFIANKFGKVNLKELKCVLTDFYSSEVLANAKSQLMKDIDNLNLSTKRPHVPLRRDGEGRLEREVSDIIQLLTFLDENKALSDLPVYASANPDNLPSMRIYEGDLNVIMKKLVDMNMRIDDVVLTLAAIVDRTQVRNTAPVTSSPSAAGGAINNLDADRRPVGVNILGNSTETETRLLGVPDWAVIASTPCENRYAPLSTADDEVAVCDDEFTVVSRDRRTNKRARQQSSPTLEADRRRQRQRPQQQQQQQQRSQQQHQQQQQQRSARRAPTVYGKASNVRGRNITAAKITRRKVVFCLDNLAKSCTVEDVCEYVSRLSVKVITCFKVNSRRRRDDTDEDEAADRAAFRLCIHEDEQDKLLDPDAWPDSVKISPWFFKKPGVTETDQSDRRSDRRSARIVASSHTRPSSPTATTSTAAPSCLVVVRDDSSATTATPDNTAAVQAACGGSVVAVLKDNNDDTTVVTDMGCDDGDDQ